MPARGMALLLLCMAAAPAATVAGQTFTPPSITRPVMRIGLATKDNRVVRLEADGGLRLIDRDTGAAPW